MNDNYPGLVISAPGKSASIGIDLSLDTEIIQMFPHRLARETPIARNATISGGFVGDVRAAGFDVIFAPTINNPRHVRIVSETGSFDKASDLELLSIAFDRIAKAKKARGLNQ
jgi:hypothetical protein